ncbi:hypothetical protein LF1_17990 [Rubripirellula obstinata]|uniref:Secreted protein n=1 Tax=Rubripirellula obstinata TaxID=406547 RepID=A0A5B1CHS9_9BACT|nr:hypothetical protein LF1_17990 [Rubripirellula obstinata]
MKISLPSPLVILSGICAVAICGSSNSSVAQADQSSNAAVGQQLVGTLLQDEIDELPEDNTAYFTATREVQLQLDLLAATSAATDLDDVMVSVIRPDGKTTRVKPDIDGKVTIENAQPGPHAVVASGEGSHGSTLFYFDEKQEDGDALDSGLAAPTPVKQLTMLQIDPENLRPSIDRIRPYVNSEYAPPASVGVGGSFNYSVTLGPDGVLSGRVISLIKEIPTQGTQVTIFYAGQQVGSTVAGPGGSFQIKGLRGGVHGVVASGRAGFAAFAFEAKQTSELAKSNGVFQQTFVSVLQGDEQLPVVLIPPTMTEQVIEEVEERYPLLRTEAVPSGVDAPVSGLNGFTGGPFGPPAGGFAPGGGYSAGGGGGGIPFGGGGGGALGGIAGLALVAALADDDDENPPIVAPQPSSPAVPQ